MSNTFELEWPRGSGTIGSFPEIDRAEWTAEPAARSRLVKGQLPVLDALVRHLGLDPAAPGPGHDKSKSQLTFFVILRGGQLAKRPGIVHA